MVRRKHVNPPLSIYKKIALSFIVLTLVLLGVIFYFTFSYAYISITPKQEEVNTDFNFVIVENADAENFEQGIFIGKIINQTTAGEKIYPATGTKPLAKGIIGKVKIINNLAKSQALIPTTRLLAPDGTLFRLKNRVDLPAKASVEAEVYPDDPTKASVSEGTKFTIPGLNISLQDSVYAEAVTDIKPDSQEVKVVSQEDIDKATESLANELAQSTFSEDDSTKTKILSKDITVKTISNKAGDEVENFSVKLEVKVVGVIFDDKSVKEFAVNSLQSLVPGDKQLVANNSDNIIFEIEKYDLNNKTAQLKGSIKGMAIISESSPILDREKLIKLKAEDLQAYLKSFDDITNVEVKLFPSWLNKMPYFADHIIIKINQ